MPITGAGRPFGGTHLSDSYSFRWKQPVGSNVALADGSVRFLTDAADPAILTALATVAGGEPAPEW